ncbi:MOSC domain-containing protein, partial [Pseudomonas sp. MWU13-2860]
TVDPDTGIKSPEQQPLRTLVSIRTLPEGVCFGVNLVPRNEGALELGAEFRVLESRYEF